MFEGVQFSLTDMTPYNRQSYFELVGLYNQAVWPVHILATAMAIFLLVAIFRPNRYGLAVPLLILGAAWVWCGWVFHKQYYASINWAGTLFAYLFLVQGFLFLATGRLAKMAIMPALKYRMVQALLVFALILHPLTGLWEGRALSQLEWFALTPTPTLIATIALLMLIKGRVKYALMLLPLLWGLINLSFAWTLKLFETYSIPVVFCVSLVFLISERADNGNGRQKSAHY